METRQVKRMETPEALKILSLLALTILVFIGPDQIRGFAIIAIVIIVIVSVIRSKLKRKAQKLKALQSVENFTLNEFFISCDGNSAIAIDKESKRICYVNNVNVANIYPHTTILESELLEDSQSVSKMSATRSIGGFALGGLAGGMAGAVVGGLSGKRTSFSTVKEIRLKFRVNDLHTPALTVLFMNELSHVKTTGWEGITYRKAAEPANHWHDILSVLIKTADKELQERMLDGQNKLVDGQNKLVEGQSTFIQTRSNPILNNNLLADELTKLHSLKEKGILTEDEFNIQKEKLLK